MCLCMQHAILFGKKHIDVQFYTEVIVVVVVVAVVVVSCVCVCSMPFCSVRRSTLTYSSTLKSL